MRRSDPAVLPLRVKLSYGVGDFGLNLYWQSLSLFLIYFQTDILGLPAYWVGVAALLSALTELVCDPLAAFWVGRTVSRFGAYRLFVLAGAPVLAIAYTACFSAPPLQGPALIVFGVTMPILLRGAYSMVSIPYSAMTTALAAGRRSRTVLTGYRMAFAALGAIGVTWLLPNLTRIFSPKAPAAGYSAAAAVVGALSMAALWVCAFGVGQPAPQPSSATQVQGGSGFFRRLIQSPPALRLLSVIALVQIGVALHMRNLIFIFKYRLHAEPLLNASFWMLPLIGCVSVPGWVALSHRFGAHISWAMGGALSVCASVGLAFAPPQAPLLTLIGYGGVFCGMSCQGVAMFSILPEIIDHNAEAFGVRDEAMLYAAGSVVQKGALGFGGLMIGGLLGATHFVPNAKPSPLVLETLTAMVSWAPAACYAATVPILLSGRLSSRRGRGGPRVENGNAQRPA